MLGSVHKWLIGIFGWFALSAFHEETRLGGKAVWMYLSHHRPEDAVIADSFHAIGINFTVVLIVGIAVVWVERRYPALAGRRSPAEARALLRTPEWVETAHSKIETAHRGIRGFFR